MNERRKNGLRVGWVPDDDLVEEEAVVVDGNAPRQKTSEIMDVP